MLLLNIKKNKKKTQQGVQWHFCKEMSSRVEEPFYKNICFLGIDTKYCSDLYMFLIRLNHLIAVLAIFEKAPACSPDTSKWLVGNEAKEAKIQEYKTT